MKNPQKPVYKYCFVPECKNTIISAPDKVFFPVPTGAKIRKQWCKIIRRSEVAPKSYLHCCEDHFNIEKDSKNFVQYNIMKQEGVKVSLRLNKGVLPHIFPSKNKSKPPSITKRGTIKRERFASLEEALSEPPAKRSNVLEICEAPQTSNDVARCGSSHIEDSHKIVNKIKNKNSNSLDNEKKFYIDKAVQVNIKTKHRSKSVDPDGMSSLSPKVKSEPSSSSESSWMQDDDTLFTDNSDGMSMSYVCTVKSEPRCSSESSWMQDSDSDNEKQYKSLCAIV